MVDPGFVKEMVHNPKTGMDALLVTPISQAQAKQRAGRAGRTGPGKAYRLYTERTYRRMLPTPVPEIQRINLAPTVLNLKAMGIEDPLHFDFMDAPSEEAMIHSLNLLRTLSALDDEEQLTWLGRRMAKFPLEPSLSKMLIMSAELHCSDEMLTIVSMLSVLPPEEETRIGRRKEGRVRTARGGSLDAAQCLQHVGGEQLLMGVVSREFSQR